MASQAVIESTLRPFSIGPSQWFVLYRLATGGPHKQRDLVQALGIERATMTGIAAALVRKGLVQQIADPDDQRQKTLVLTDDGQRLWNELPDPIALTLAVAFTDSSQDDVDLVVRVLSEATGRLTDYLEKEKS